MLRRRRSQKALGFSLMEVLITLTLLGILLGLAAPAFGEWIRNSQVRTVADALQNGVRLAQGEALRRNRQVIFFLTNSADCSATMAAAEKGAYWSIRTVPLISDDVVEVVQCGVLSDVAAGVAVDGPTAMCFNSMGRQVVNTNTGLGVNCGLDASGRSTYKLTKTASRPLRVVVALTGQPRLCDPARTLSAETPDGCPT
jgi:type IV fimbrial biogenesis protein FimT